MKKCEKCGNVYSEEKLKDSNNNNNNNKTFDICPCGGKLIFIQPLIGHITDEIDPINEFTVYPECTPLDGKNEENQEKDLKMGVKAKARLNKSKK